MRRSNQCSYLIDGKMAALVRAKMGMTGGLGHIREFRQAREPPNGNLASGDQANPTLAATTISMTPRCKFPTRRTGTVYSNVQTCIVHILPHSLVISWAHSGVVGCKVGWCCAEHASLRQASVWCYGGQGLVFVVLVQPTTDETGHCTTCAGCAEVRCRHAPAVWCR